MNSSAKIRQIQDPTLPWEGALAPRATMVPALHRDVFYRNRNESELLMSLNGDYRFSYQTDDCIPDFFDVDYDDAAWDSIDVPSMWQYRGY
ncbi:MAG: hypothetical protein II229_05230, partial [Clostridia bacterium]|nr:hypothetical protein [Clostridia bacterium]